MIGLTRTLVLVWTALIGLAAALLLGMAWLSLRWPIEHDAPIMLYIAYLIDEHGRVPYRDIFCLNMPAVYLLHAAWGRWLGAYDALGFRIVDLAQLLGILVGGALWMRSFGRHVAALGAMLFGLWYLCQGTTLSLQREYILMLPLVWALVLADPRRSLRFRVRFFLVGLLFGCAAAIKPTSVVGLPWLLWMMLRDEARPIRFRGAGFALAGFALPLLGSGLYLVASGGWSEFVSLATHYWPLYGALGRQHQLVLSGRPLYLLSEFVRFGKQAWWLAPAIVGGIFGWRVVRADPLLRRQFVLMAGLAVSYIIYVVIAGKFWVYHWLPFMFFALQFAALSASAFRPWGLSVAALVVLVGVASTQLRAPKIVAHQLREGEIRRIKGDRVDALAAYLKENVQPGQTVQPLDWAGGAVNAMLMARVPLATRFVYDFHFYHHVHEPYIQGLQARFLEELAEKRPDFIVEVHEWRPRPSGPRTTGQFPALREFLRDYRAVESVTNGVTIYRRRDEAG